MYHIIINPVGGKGESAKALEKVTSLLDSKGVEYEVHKTERVNHAAEIARELSKAPGTDIIAMGGDGSFHEVLCGIENFENVTLGLIACGSGNDFIKYYGKAEDFLDIESLVSGVDHRIDIMKVCGRYSVNVVHFGFDTAVLKTMQKVKRKRIIGGKNAYTTGVVTAFLNGMKTECKITVDGKRVGKEKLLLGTVANGKYVGGAYMCAPKSLNDDGLAEVCIINPVSRFKFLTLIKTYAVGRYLDDKRFDKIVNYCRGNIIELEAKDGFYVSIDGELTESSHVKVEVVPKAVNFAIPYKLAAKLGIDKERESVVC